MLKSRRQALALSAVLAATVLTGGAAFLGIAHGPSHVRTAAAPAPAAVVQPAPAPQVFGEVE
jgi:hypothetical protein